jgi:hypothetical protein
MMAGLPGIHTCILGGDLMTNRELDIEWMELIKQALDAGISKKEIREFLNQQSEEMKAKYEVI